MAAVLPASTQASHRTQQLLQAPLLPTLLRLATPNVIGLFAMTVQIGYDGFILGRLGHEALAGVALVLPLSMLMVQMSAGGIGGATTAAVARALGAGRPGEAAQLARHALLVALAMAARLEYILVPIAFGFGTALTTLVATNMGAGQTARALRAAWLGGGVVAAITGAIGLTVALAPGLWMDAFTADPQVRAQGAVYLRIVGASYGLFGLGLALFFASQGAGRMLWPLVGSLARLALVAAGGWICVGWLQAPASAFYAVVAASLALYAAVIAGAIRFGRWTR